MDFRGRAYPTHPYLNHMGDDVSRGLLHFAEARPLGPHGLDWLLVHVANMWGQGEDKRSNAERREFTRRHLPQVKAGRGLHAQAPDPGVGGGLYTGTCPR